MELDVGAPAGPGRVRTNANASATVEVSGPLRRSSHSSQVRAAARRRRASRPRPPRCNVCTGGPGGSRRRRAGRGATSTPSARSCSAGPMPGQHQQLRGADRAGGEDHLAAGASTCSRPRVAGSGRRSRARRRARRAAPSRRVTTSRFGRLHRRAQVGVGGAPALAVALGDLDQRRAVLLGAVVVVDVADAGRLGGREEAAVSGRGERCVLDPQRAAGAVVLGRAARVVLGRGSTGCTSSQPQPGAPAPQRS